MKNNTIMLCVAMAMICGMANAQKPYNEAELYEVNIHVKNTRSTPTISDFVSAMLEETEDEVHGSMSRDWQQYLSHKPLGEGTNILLDEKNGYFRYDVDFDKKYGDERGSTLYVEVVIWNCADGQHKLLGENVGGTINGKPSSGQYDGVIFYLYNKNTRKMYALNDALDAAELSSLTPSQEWQYDGKQWYYAKDHLTGERRQMSSEEFDQWLEDRPMVSLSLPRVGKDITASVCTARAKKDRSFKWDGYRFHLTK